MTAEELISRVSCDTRLCPTGGDTYRAGLEVMLEDLFGNEQIPMSARAAQIGTLEAMLRIRLSVDTYHEGHPALSREVIERPLFIVGLPRTGTTYLNRLLNADPRRRGLLGWEAVDPIPPVDRAGLKTDPRCLAMLEKEREQVKKLAKLASIHWTTADEPTECGNLHAQDFKAFTWTAMLPLPRYKEWISACNMSSAYRHQKRVLQILQSKANGIWTLKSPSHSLSLSSLFEVFGDARLVAIYRDPRAVVASNCSLTREIHTVFNVKSSGAEIAKDCVESLLLHTNRLLRDLGPGGVAADRILWLDYDALVESPIATVRRVYEWCGVSFTAEAESEMTGWLQTRAKNQYGKHEYSLSDFGMNDRKVLDLFLDYSDSFKTFQVSSPG